MLHYLLAFATACRSAVFRTSPICKSAPRSTQITTPAPHHSVFTGCMPFLLPNQQRQSTEGQKQHTHTHTHPFNSPFSDTTQVSWYQKGKTNLDFTEARDSEWQWHQLGHMQVCTSLQTDNHASIPPLRPKGQKQACKKRKTKYRECFSGMHTCCTMMRRPQGL